jgi:hypothetical protein
MAVGEYMEVYSKQMYNSSSEMGRGLIWPLYSGLLNDISGINTTVLNGRMTDD